MQLLIGDNLVVSMHYKLSDDKGNMLDSSEGSEPLVYLHGSGNIIPGLETALKGKVAGESCDVRIEPADAYGAIKPELVVTMKKEAFQGIDKLEPGMRFEAQGEDGSVHPVLVKSVQGDEVTIDANHPLAGMVLNFKIDIVDVREATKEEISHGHVH